MAPDIGIKITPNIGIKMISTIGINEIKLLGKNEPKLKNKINKCLKKMPASTRTRLKVGEIFDDFYAKTLNCPRRIRGYIYT